MKKWNIKLIEEISIKRKNLTVNIEITINIFSFYENDDLSNQIMKEKFEKII